MLRIGIIGVPGSGKTSLARSITSACRHSKSPNLNRIELVSEYARRYISKHGDINEIWEQYRIMEKQIEWEDSIPINKTDLLITDSPVHLGFLYASELVTNKPKDIMVYNDIFKKLSKLNENKPRYDLIIHLPPDIKPIDDGVRPELHFNDEWRYQSDIKIKFLFETVFRPKMLFSIQETDMKIRTQKAIKYINKDEFVH